MNEPTDELPSQPHDESLATATGDEELLAALADEFAARVRSGERPTVEEYVAKHPELEERIRAVLQAIAFMEETRSFHSPAGERPGSTIGRYKLLERIGEGGFGVVYMAEQQIPVRRKVALKVIKPGLDTRQVIARFEAERQALALMEHENIARVLDAGATDSGRPYFVMELVHGVPITEFCDKNQLSPRERLELFVRVCRAVQHAHTKGIIHRDIKPTNVLVTLHDGVGVPKVIDFGVAKATGQQLTEKTLFTNFAQMVGTPLYMSPEQAEMTSIDVDTRSDVYSLGVLLYELLTGTTPLDSERLKRSAFDEIRRIIREEEPPRPSTRLSTMGDQAKTISARRKSDPRHLGQLIRGELDWIVMKALEKDRSRRYETANGLARDIERYLRDEQVEACPPTAAYRFRKLARRHRTALLAASGALLILLTLVVGLTVSNRMIAAERDRKEAALHGEQRAVALAKARGNEAAKNLVVARENERTARHALYAARINVAQQAAASADVDRLLELLNSLRPEVGQEDLRGFEWYYLWRLCHSELLKLEEFSSPVRTSVFSPDGKVLAAGHGAEVKLFNPDNGELLATIPAARHQIRSLAFSPDGALIAVAGGKADGVGEVQVWDVAARKPKLVLSPFDEPVSAVTFSPDGESVATATAAFVTGSNTDTTHDLSVKPGTRPDRVRLWDLASGEALGSFEGATEGVLSVALSPDGKFLAGGSVDGQVIVWQTSTFRRESSHPSGAGYVSAVAFSPDGKSLAMGCGPWYRPGQFILFDFPSMQVRRRVTGLDGGATSVAFSPDGQGLAVGTHDRSVSIFATGAGSALTRFVGHRHFVSSVAFSLDGRKLASSSWDNTVRLWDVGSALTDARARASGGLGVVFYPDGRAMTQLTVIDRAAGAVKNGDGVFKSDSNVAVSPDGRTVAVGGLNGHVVLLDSDTLAPVREFGGARKVWAVAFSPDGRILASGGSDDRVTLRDPADGRVIRVLQPEGVTVRSLAFSPDGLQLATSTWGGTAAVQMWDLRGDHPARQIGKHGASCVRFSPDGMLLAVARQNKIGLHDARSGDMLKTFAGHSSEVWEIAFSPDGRTLASSSWDRTLRLWSVSSRELLLTFRLDATGFAVAFSPDGRTLAATAWGTRFWDAADPVEADQHIDGVLHHVAALRRGGRLEQAEQFVRANLDRYRQQFGDGHVWTARARVELASLLIDRRNTAAYPEAEALVTTARSVLGKKLIPGHEWRWRALDTLRDLYGPAAWNDVRKSAEIAALYSESPSTTRPSTTRDVAATASARSTDQTDADLSRALALNTHAWALANGPDLAKRDPDGAVTLAKEAVELAPSNADFWNTLGVAQYRAGNWNEAIFALRKYRELRASDAEWTNPFFLAMAHWQFGDKDEAARWNETAVKWMDAAPARSTETMRRFRSEAAELLGLNDPHKQHPSSHPSSATTLPN